MSELFLALLFLGVIIFQAIRIKEMIIFERKTKGMYVAMVIGCFIILGITVYYGSTFVHLITGLLGIVMLIHSLFVTGISKGNFYYYSPGKLVGQKLSFSDSSHIRLETFDQNQIIIRFVAHSSERILKFSKKDEQKVKDMLDYNYRSID